MSNLPARNDDADQKAQALMDLESITTLLRTSAFLGYFMREPREKIAQLDKALRKRDLPEGERQFILGQLDVLERGKDKLAQDERSNRMIAGQK